MLKRDMWLGIQQHSPSGQWLTAGHLVIWALQESSCVSSCAQLQRHMSHANKHPSKNPSRASSLFFRSVASVVAQGSTAAGAPGVCRRSLPAPAAHHFKP